MDQSRGPRRPAGVMYRAPRESEPQGRQRGEWTPRESRPQERWPIPTGKKVALSGLAALLVIVLVGTTALVLRDLSAQRASAVVSRPTATLTSGTPTPDLRDPKSNGWTQAVPGEFDQAAFAWTGSQRSYFCGANGSTGARSFGVTTDGGQTWKVGAGPFAYDDCTISVSAANPLDIALTSAPYAGTQITVDGHYSVDGGKTWKAAPIPSGTLDPAGAVWAGSYLYAWSGPNKDSGQHGFLQVSSGGGPFTSIDPGALLAGAQNVSIWRAVASSDTVYLNIAYNRCSAQNCEGIVKSADGGHTWTQVPNTANGKSVWLAAASGGALYGTLVDAPNSTSVVSTDDGATWSAQTLPKLPDGSDPGLCVPASDGACYLAFGAGMAYLPKGATTWTVVLFSSDRQTTISGFAAVPAASGHVGRLWLAASGNPLSVGGKTPGIYWHALP